MPERSLEIGFAKTGQPVLPQEAVERVHEYLGIANVPTWCVSQAPYLAPGTQFLPSRPAVFQTEKSFQ